MYLSYNELPKRKNNRNSNKMSDWSSHVVYKSIFKLFKNVENSKAATKNLV